MHLTGIELLIALVAAVVGALVQGSIGFGMNLVLVPVVALVEPAALPATTLFLAVPLTIGMLAREHRHADRSGVLWHTVGRVPGSAIGAWIVTAVSADALAALIGGFVVLAALTSIAVPPVRVTRVSAALAGVASGTMGTASSIGGPPTALLYQHHTGPVVRATLAYTFALGTLVSATALAVAGEIAGWHLLAALALTPGVLAGLLLARRLHAVLDRGWLRPAVLTFAIVAGTLAIVRGLA
jgi:uncharacterized membrane protein YfcA